MTDLTLRSQVVHLALKRNPPKNIAQQLDVDVDLVYAEIRAARADGVEIPGYAPERIQLGPKSLDHHVVVPIRLKAILDLEAQRTGRDAGDIARTILERGLLNMATRHV